ncbi:pyrroline-5-carboxylate reductase [Alkalimarinus alittae]|uniref:Pyrroline-5-carboxylate reductase n=1 Tax=Alkalimarinus alittae TaxID=2961619 RepID=A0ABY6N1P2_9ALTE|nr:pyrroline-5-carboxylate reductase [Alkalimarinus alittae]UZE95940.1 pyrroline-5-carboxylate reductase [Alkalimarinus alittae]
MDKKPHIVFIGAGNMASSIIGGLVASGYPASLISASAPSQEHLDALSTKYQINTTQNNHSVAAEADILVLAVKPQILQAVCTDLASPLNDKNPLIISIAAGVETPHIEQWLGKTLPIIRCMPNTPALVSQGASGLFANAQVSAEQRQQADEIFQSIGVTQWITLEDQMHGITALSGSGPAYFFLMMEALEDAAVKTGIPRETARKLGIQTVLGAAEMAKQSELEPAQLKRNVMSPGGTTERAIQSFEDGGIRAIFATAVSAAANRSKELAELLGKQ